MALAWNVGWVNSPRGFKSRILRSRSKARPATTSCVSSPLATRSRRPMRRKAAIFWHASLSILGGVAYYIAVLPRPFELTGEISHGLGTAGRVICGVLIGLAALPVVL